MDILKVIEEILEEIERSNELLVDIRTVSVVTFIMVCVLVYNLT